MIESLLLKWNALSPRDRRMLVLAGGFLADLYYRLNVVLLDLTPRS